MLILLSSRLRLLRLPLLLLGRLAEERIPIRGACVLLRVKPRAV
jgi:hypothetical protein